MGDLGVFAPDVGNVVGLVTEGGGVQTNSRVKLLGINCERIQGEEIEAGII